MRNMILIALLLPALAMAGQSASQASFLQYKQCLLSVAQPSDKVDDPAAIFAAARSKCAAARAKLSADIIAGLRSEGRPESLSRRIAEDAVEKLESGLKDDVVRPAAGTR